MQPTFCQVHSNIKSNKSSIKKTKLIKKSKKHTKIWEPTLFNSKWQQHKWGSIMTVSRSSICWCASSTHWGTRLRVWRLTSWNLTRPSLK
jgi:hypothetical protein